MRAFRLALANALSWFVLVLASVCAIAALGAHLGRVSAEWDVLAHFAPGWLIGCSAAGFASMMLNGRRRAIGVALSSAGVVAAAALMIPELARDTGPRASAEAPGAVKIVQMNVWSDGQRTQTNLDWLMRQGADIIVLEETYYGLRQELLRQPGWHVICETCETVIMSRQAPVSVGPMVDRWQPGPLVRAVFRDAYGEYTVIGVHHSWPTEIGVQQAQEGQLAAALTLSPLDRTIVAGDFNSTPWSFSRRRWDAIFGLPRRERALSSWPALSYKQLKWLGLFPFLPIDHVYAGEAWGTVSVKRGPRLGSDHYPIVVTLAPVVPRKARP